MTPRLLVAKTVFEIVSLLGGSNLEVQVLRRRRVFVTVPLSHEVWLPKALRLLSLMPIARFGFFVS